MSWALLLAALVAGAEMESTAQAAKHKGPGLPKAVRNETYTAMESPQAAAEANSRGVAPKPVGWGVYDKVPPNYRELMLDRLEIVKALIRDHGRAYDYRIHTKRDLEKVLADLGPALPPHPAPPPPDPVDGGDEE